MIVTVSMAQDARAAVQLAYEGGYGDCDHTITCQAVNIMCYLDHRYEDMDLYFLMSLVEDIMDHAS